MCVCKSKQNWKAFSWNNVHCLKYIYRKLRLQESTAERAVHMLKFELLRVNVSKRGSRMVMQFGFFIIITVRTFQ